MIPELGTTQAQRKLFYNLIQEQKKMEAQGKLALPDTLSEKLHVKTSEVEEMTTRLSSNAEVSIDQPLNSQNPDSKNSLIDIFQDNSNRPDIIVENNEMLNVLKEKLNEFSKTLNPKEISVLRDRLLSETPNTLQEIANKHGISKERTRQLEVRILKNLKLYLKEFS